MKRDLVCPEKIMKKAAVALRPMEVCEDCVAVIEGRSDASPVVARELKSRHPGTIMLSPRPAEWSWFACDGDRNPLGGWRRLAFEEVEDDELDKRVPKPPP